jgi:signal transduction histidine kinase
LSRARIATLLVVILSITAAHYLTPTRQHGLHALYRWFYYLPIILGSFWFGIRGGLGLAAFITAIYLPHVLLQWSGGGAIHWLEIVLYNVIGGVTGVLAERQRRERDRYRRAAEELNVAYSELKESTSALLETEQQLLRADRLSVLGELSAGLAHEIRTPLASIRGAAEILAGPADGGEREEFAAILIKEVDRLNRVLGEFLTFARPGQEGGESSEPAAAIREVASLLRLSADRAGVALETNIDEGLPRVTVAEEALKQVLLNLLMNALQAGGGVVRVRAIEDPPWIVVPVEDDGPGIPEAERERVFEPFVTMRENGTGLGLSVVRRILDGNGAMIDLGDGVAGGALVTVRLPTMETSDGG